MGRPNLRVKLEVTSFTTYGKLETPPHTVSACSTTSTSRYLHIDRSIEGFLDKDCGMYSPGG